jgi:hypothetical protein
MLAVLGTEDEKKLEDKQMQLIARGLLASPAAGRMQMDITPVDRGTKLLGPRRHHGVIVFRNYVDKGFDHFVAFEVERAAFPDRSFLMVWMKEEGSCDR